MADPFTIHDKVAIQALEIVKEFAGAEEELVHTIFDDLLEYESLTQIIVSSSIAPPFLGIDRTSFIGQPDPLGSSEALELVSSQRTIHLNQMSSVDILFQKFGEKITHLFNGNGGLPHPVGPTGKPCLALLQHYAMLIHNFSNVRSVHYGNQVSNPFGNPGSSVRREMFHGVQYQLLGDI